MDALLFIARLAIAMVFGVAGLAKLADLSATRGMLVNVGLPAFLAHPLAIALPVTELVIAVALLPATTAQVASLAAITILLVFSAVISLNLAYGKRPNCRCFGQFHAAPLGPETLVRNGVLAAVAGLVAWQGPGTSVESAVVWIAETGIASAVGVLALVGMFAANVWLQLNVLRQHGRLLLRVEKLEQSLWRGAVLAAPAAGLPVGASAPHFHLPLVNGGSLSLDALLADGKPVFMIFSAPECAHCNELLPEVAEWQRDQAATVTILVLSTRTISGARPRQERGVSNVLLQEDNAVMEAYRAEMLSAVVINIEGIIASPLGVGADGVGSLLDRTLDGSLLALSIEGHRHGPGLHLPTPPRPGTPAPPLRLPNPAGGIVDLGDFRGRQVILLFWDPACSLCRHLLTDVMVWEASEATGATDLLLVSTGQGTLDRLAELRSAVVLDESFASSRSFGIYGTPSALLVDADGRIYSELAVGTAAVRSLLRARQYTQAEDAQFGLVFQTDG